MILTKEYIEEQKKCIKANYYSHSHWEEVPTIKDRYIALRKYCAGAKKILCLGSGAVEPRVIGATHAVDVDISAGDLLREKGWKGSFYVGSCDNLSKGWSMRGKFFDVAVCSEVIEHLPDLETVKKTFQEINRVAKRWIVTTPAIRIADPGHVFFFTKPQLQDITKNISCYIVKYKIHFYIYNDERKIF